MSSQSTGGCWSFIAMIWTGALKKQVLHHRIDTCTKPAKHRDGSLRIAGSNHIPDMCGGGAVMNCAELVDSTFVYIPPKDCDYRGASAQCEQARGAYQDASTSTPTAVGSPSTCPGPGSKDLCKEPRHVLAMTAKKAANSSRFKPQAQIVGMMLRVAAKQAASVTRMLGEIRRQRKRVVSRAKDANSHVGNAASRRGSASKLGQLIPNAGERQATNSSRMPGSLPQKKKTPVRLVAATTGFAGSRPGVGSPYTAAKGNAVRSLQIIKGVLIEQPADGSCLFHSIAYGLNDGTTGPSLRRQLVAFMGQNQLYKIADTTIKEWVQMTSGKTVPQYIQRLSQSNTWGGALELALAAKLKAVNIHVHKRCGDGYRCIATFDMPEAVRTVNIVYRTVPCKHYDALSVNKQVKCA